MGFTDVVKQSALMDARKSMQDAEGVSMFARFKNAAKFVKAEKALDTKAAGESEDLKSLISKACGIPVEQQKLICEGCLVTEHNSVLWQNGIGHGSTVLVYAEKPKKKSTLRYLATTAMKEAKKASSSFLQSRLERCAKRNKAGALSWVVPKWQHDHY